MAATRKEIPFDKLGPIALPQGIGETQYMINRLLEEVKILRVRVKELEERTDPHRLAGYID